MRSLEEELGVCDRCGGCNCLCRSDAIECLFCGVDFIPRDAMDSICGDCNHDADIVLDDINKNGAEYFRGG